MRVLVADKFPPEGRAALSELGLSVVDAPSLTVDDLPAAVAEHRPEILIVRSTEVRAGTFEADSPLALVVRAGAGVNTIDLDAASRAGVFVTNCPGKNAIAVAELTMGLILASDRRIPDAVAAARAGRWRKKEFSKAQGLAGRRLGLVGFGSIAREVARRALAFDMEVSAWSRTLTPASAKAAGVIRADGLEAMLDRSDVLSVHVPYGKATHHMLDAAALKRLPDGALVVHTARGGVIDDAALTAEVTAGRLRAAVDVLEGEPAGGEADLLSALATAEGAYVTPHVGASTEQAQQAIADEVVRIVREYTTAGNVPNCVNLRSQRSPCTVVVRHLDRVGVLAAVLEALRQENLNVQHMNNVIFASNGPAAAAATITLAGRPSEDVLQRLRGRDDILAIAVRD